MAGVYLYRDVQTGVDVAVKLLDARLLDNVASGTARFTAEAKCLAGLNHPNVVPVFAAGTAGGFYWYAMEYCPAGTLRDAIKGRGGAPPQLAARWMFETLLGLQAVHQRGMIHRDIKPSNLLLAVDGRVRIADFGIARHPRGQVPFRTISGSGMGSSGFAAPELQIDASTADVRADLYSVGATFYQVLTGIGPGNLMFMEVEPSVLDEVPAELRAIIRTSISPDMNDRYDNTYTMARALISAIDAWATRTGAGVDAPAWLSEWGGPGLGGWLRGLAARLGIAA